MGTHNPYSLVALIEWLESWAEDVEPEATLFNIHDYEDGKRIIIEKA